MYSETDINAAVDAGVITPQVAAAFRNYVAANRSAPAVDEESFRLLTGFNDIFVAIALALSLAAIAQIGAWIWAPVGGLAVAVSAWLLAEYFTRQRLMALPSILLMLAFVGGVVAVPIAVLAGINPDLSDRVNAVIVTGISLLALGAAWLHWRRFMVPITIAAGALAVVAIGFGLVVTAFADPKQVVFPVTLAGGVAVFAFAMWWDMSDRQRTTRRSDVAFWLHLAAAPLIAHPVFHMLGVFDQNIGVGMAMIVIALYAVFGFVALAVDRRALLVSSLAYVLFALYGLFKQAGAVELSAAFTALVIGSALLTLSAFWHPMRRLVVGTLGNIGTRLPPVNQPLAA